jgi:hypothetical protein
MLPSTSRDSLTQRESLIPRLRLGSCLQAGLMVSVEKVLLPSADPMSPTAGPSHPRRRLKSMRWLVLQYLCSLISRNRLLLALSWRLSTSRQVQRGLCSGRGTPATAPFRALPSLSDQARITIKLPENNQASLRSARHASS